MPRKHFLADLEKVQRPGEVDSCIIDVKRGDDDGSFVCTFVPPGLGASGIEITGMIPELSDYPISHQTILYASSDDPPPAATSALDGISYENSSMSLPVLISTISKSLTKAMDTNTSTFISSADSDDIEMEEYSEEYDEDSDVSVGGWEEPSEYYNAESENIDGDNVNQDNEQDLQHATGARGLIAALRKDLRSAKEAGFKIGVLGDWKGGMDHYVSLGIRVTKLGISDEAVAAWKLDKRKYLILLIHYSSFYQSLDKLTGESGGYHVKRSVEMCVGTATRYKPTSLEAMGAFSKISSMGNSAQMVGGESGELEAGATVQDQSNEDGFQGIFVSRPLNELLNSRLIQLIKYRIQLGFGWDGAEAYYVDHQGRESSSIGQVSDKYYIDEPPKAALAPIVTKDALQYTSTDASFPLLAMQFTLRHLVRCTEFCLVCHTKVHSDFEALKPYVCSSPLCLYQYMSLGFGPSIEYEIVSQPTVVDLLVSFCYVAAKSDKLSEFPSGMNLTVPIIPFKPFHATYHRLKNELQFFDVGDQTIPTLKVGDWLQIHTGTVTITANEFVHARVLETMYYPTIKLGPPVGKSKSPGTAIRTYVTPTGPPTGPPTVVHQSTSPVVVPDIIPVTFCVYDISFDTLTDEVKRQNLTSILDTLPSVVEMRNWLQRNTKVGEGASLGAWKERVSPAALGVLRWIIASNRSCIVPVDQELDSDGFIVAGSGSRKGGEQRVWGMGDWLQFRFAMGAPDKEQRFVEAVQSAQQRLNLIHPSLFAFHGSPLGNWHSIIREGLHFKQTVHGRAFGHGCYHSLDLSTSLGYSGGMGYHQNTLQATWPQSVLNIRTALCLNEIVNAPNEFVSKTPHLVVAQLEWIQTRYMFIQMADKSQGVDGATDSIRPNPVHLQDEVYTPKGLHGKLVIPATVSSSRTRNPIAPAPLPTPALSPTSKGMHGSKAKKKTLSGLSHTFSNFLDPILGSASSPIIVDDDGFEDDASIMTDTTDLMALVSDDEEPSPPPRNGKGVMGALSTASFSQPIKPGGFVPGILDISDLPQLEFPSYASGSATKRIQSDLRSIIKLQQTQSLDELGFYVDESRTDNIYQWIVELHSFPDHLPLVKDMKTRNIQSIVLEMRFGSQYPMSPPFVRVIKPRFMGFAQGGGGHVTVGGALCMELLTNSGWSAVSSLESVLLQVRMAIGEETPPARLAPGPVQCYGPLEAKEAYLRACRNHGWAVPADFSSIV